jgi:hypothetical protein
LIHIDGLAVGRRYSIVDRDDRGVKVFVELGTGIPAYPAVIFGAETARSARDSRRLLTTCDLVTTLVLHTLPNLGPISEFCNESEGRIRNGLDD